MRKTVLCILMIAASAAYFQSKAQDYTESDKIRGTWLNEDGKAKVYVFRGTDGKYYGKIVWLKEPLEDGKPKVDDENPDPAKKDTPLINLMILKGFRYKGESVYKEGTIYDPDNGKTYNCIMTLSSANKLDIRGYIGISLIGRTSYWTRSE